jgi:hypothetical protein
VPVGIVALLVSVRVVPESSDRAGRRLDLPGQLLAVTGLACVTYAIIEGNTKGWRSPAIVTLLAVSAAALVSFVAVEHASPSPLLRLGFFRHPTFSAANSVGFLAWFGFAGTLFFLSLFLQNVQGYPAVAAGARFVPLTGALIVTAPVAGRITGRIGSSRLPMSLGLLVSGGGLLLLTRIGRTTGYAGFWWNFAIIGVGFGLTISPMTAAVMGSVPLARAGMASAVNNTSRQVGGVLGVALLGTLVTGRLASALGRSLDGWGVPGSLRGPILAGATHGGLRSGESVTGVSAAALRQAVGDSYVSGMHLALVVAGVALLFGSLLALAFVRAPAPADRLEAARLAPALA